MTFPKVKRVQYKKNPLEKVICQLRYPPILKVDSEIPSVFQEYVRSSFPLYREKTEIIQQFPIIIGQNPPQELSQEMKKPMTTKNHTFSTEDGVWQLNLTRTSLSLTTTKYRRWEDFIKIYQIPISALMETYKPPFFTRIGLRYIDVFDRAKLGLQGTPWNKLLKPYFLGLLSSPIKDDIKNCESRYEVNLEDKESYLRMITSFVENVITREKGYLVDCDYYFPLRIGADGVNDKLEFLHDQAVRLIQFIITPKLHEAMEPMDLK